LTGNGLCSKNHNNRWWISQYVCATWLVIDISERLKPSGVGSAAARFSRKK
jgi:hypothetical protein